MAQLDLRLVMCDLEGQRFEVPERAKQSAASDRGDDFRPLQHYGPAIHRAARGDFFVCRPTGEKDEERLRAQDSLPAWRTVRSAVP